ncbi:MAG: thymidine phosphorylase [Anaerolineae bacterium]|nr:thymidine phosphorylase [Anaerolineae bacterium]
MRAADIIARKRDGIALSAEEIDFMVQGYTQDTIPDYQVAAWLMAIVLRGMERQETIDLTMAMVRSGERLEWQNIDASVVDKHSTGGVGDKTTLVVAPLVAAAGVYVGKMSGRGLGFTGGTLDKLESIPGFRADLSVEAFRAQLERIGIVVTGQSAGLVPADGKLYALRDVTATVDSLPLIASSIMSKKIAAGANGIVLDVKVGHGAFMETEDEAEELASLMVHIGTKMGRRVRAVISDMNQPLGHAVGNAVELQEAIATLHGRGPLDFREHCLTIGTQLLLVAGTVEGTSDARNELENLLDTRRAWSKFREWIEAQGGDLAFVDEPERLPSARFVRELPAPRTAYVAGLDAREIGLTSMLLGGGRAKKGDTIDHAVGVVLHAKVGARVEKGEPLLTIHADDEGKLSGAQQRLLAAYDWSDEPVEPAPLIHKVIGQG